MILISMMYPVVGGKVYSCVLQNVKYKLKFKKQHTMFGNRIMKLAYIFSSPLFESWGWNNLDERKIWLLLHRYLALAEKKDSSAPSFC